MTFAVAPLVVLSLYACKAVSREHFDAGAAGEAVLFYVLGERLCFPEEFLDQWTSGFLVWVGESVEAAVGLREGDQRRYIAFVDYGDAEFFGES